LSLIVYLAHGVKPLSVWLENRWAVPMNVAVMGIGGGLLSTAVSEFGFIGIAIFFLPILLSAYSFRVVTNKTKEQMVQLEEMVELRTADLARANKELETLNTEKDAFLAVLTHDMRTPLTSIKGYASVLKDREITPEQQQHIAKIILRSQDTLLEIVNNILEIEKLQSGTPVLLEYTTFDLALLTREAAELLEAQAAEKALTFEYERVPTPVMIEADMNRIERSVTNLISNAVKYTPRGGQVKVSTGVNGRYAFVSVNDTGYGIPPHELAHIFDRYSRVRGHQNLAVGTGLGLAIVKSLVEAHKGTIEVESEVDIGSTFTLKLPLP
jgi:two-component system, OmpR family, phosphate regulon sensor histidine kinase PhoR